MTFTIRPAAIADRPAILSLVGDAFSDDVRDGREEVEIVGATWERAASPDGFDLVAVEREVVVGHVLGALGDLGGREVLAVAPLAVAPAHQRSGVGTALMNELLLRADRAGRPLVVILGSPTYYGRFGFEPAGRCGIVYPAVGADDPAFMVRWFGAPDASYRGDFTYCWEA